MEWMKNNSKAGLNIKGVGNMVEGRAGVLNQWVFNPQSVLLELSKTDYSHWQKELALENGKQGRDNCLRKREN